MPPTQASVIPQVKLLWQSSTAEFGGHFLVFSLDSWFVTIDHCLEKVILKKSTFLAPTGINSRDSSPTTDVVASQSSSTRSTSGGNTMAVPFLAHLLSL